jgi:mRNA interferase HicA
MNQTLATTPGRPVLGATASLPSFVVREPAARIAGGTPALHFFYPNVDGVNALSVNFVRHLSTGQFCPTMASMRGNEFIKKVSNLAKKRGVECRGDRKRGKGSHETLYFGEKTVIRNPKDELKTGTLYAMLDQLGIGKNEF